MSDFLAPAPAEDPYCRSLPGQLRAWDATALRLVMECPRKFQLMQNEGWGRKGKIDLEFGSAYHKACEAFDRARLAGVGKEEATRQVFTSVVRETIGALETCSLPVWRCLSPELVPGKRDASKLVRNAARCANAKAPQWSGWLEGAACPECGAETQDDWEMVVGNKNKNRATLLRSVLFYCDTADERVRPFMFPDGTAAVELSFRVPLPLLTPDGEPYLLCGSMDGMVDVAGEVMPRERKTTKNTPGLYFFDRYAPDVQVDTYDLAAWLLYSDLLDPKPHGVMVEVTQVTQNFTRIERQVVNVPEERRAEWLKEVQVWIKQAEGYARAGFWPKNTSACGANGGCPMQSICRMAPSARERFLPGERFVRREERWNPMRVR